MRKGLALVVALAACGDDTTTQPDAPLTPEDAAPDATPIDMRTTVAEIRATPLRNLDIMFVIDNSPSMLDKQNNLRTNFPNFVNVLSVHEGGLPDLHIGVVTTDMGSLTSSSTQPGPGVVMCTGTGQGGAFQTNGATVDGTYLVNIRQTDGTRLTNYQGDLATVFSQMANVGSQGCGFEQTLSAMKAGLSNPANAGFLRTDALLAVVFLTDEDDCSIRSPMMFAPDDATLGPRQSFRCTRFGVTCSDGGLTTDAMNQEGLKDGCASNETSTIIDSVGPYQSFLRGLKTDPSRIVVAGIMAPTGPYNVALRPIPGTTTPLVPTLAESCSYIDGAGTTQFGYPATRLQQFLDGFPERNASTTICQQDLSGGLQFAASLVTRSLGSSCIVDDLGAAPDCIVEDVVGATVTAVPSCLSAGGTRPCYSTVTDAATCPTGANLRLEITRDTPADPATVTRMRCEVR